MSRILFVDDEERRMRPYVDVLGERHHVVFVADVDRAVKLIGDLQVEFDLVVLDISLPTGEAFEKADTDGGARTGLVLFDTIRSSRPAIGVVVFTNVPDERIVELFRLKSRCRFVRKSSVDPFRFAELIEEFTNQG